MAAANPTSPEALPMDEDELSRPRAEKDGDNGPPAKKRRSSILNVIRRQSKSTAGMGIPFEDQISAIAPDLPAEVRMAKLLQIAASSAIRTVKQECADESGDDDKTYDLVQDVAGTLIKDGAQNAERTRQLASQLGARVGRLQAEVAATTSAAEAMMPPRVKHIRDYTARLVAENEQWTTMFKERKKKLAVLRGERQLTVATDLCNLPPEVKDMLSQLPDERAEMAALLQLEEKLSESERTVAISLKLSRQRLDDSRARNADAVDKIKAMSDSMNAASTTQGGDSKDLDVDAFEKEVEQWISEVETVK